MSRPEYGAMVLVDELDRAADEFELEARKWQHEPEREACENWARAMRAACDQFQTGRIDHAQAVAYAVAGLQLVRQVAAMRRLVQVVVETPPARPGSRARRTRQETRP